MANEIDPRKNTGQTRRSFLAKMGLGAAAFAFIGGPLGMLGIRNKQQKETNDELPGEDSIFHPALDPRQDPRRS